MRATSISISSELSGSGAVVPAAAVWIESVCAWAYAGETKIIEERPAIMLAAPNENLLFTKFSLHPTVSLSGKLPIQNSQADVQDGAFDFDQSARKAKRPRALKRPFIVLLY